MFLPHESDTADPRDFSRELFNFTIKYRFLVPGGPPLKFATKSRIAI